MAVNTEIFDEREQWRGPLLWSAAFHLAITASVLAYGAYVGGMHSQNWGSNGSGGSAMSATLVSSIPLPAKAVQTESVLASESKGLSQSMPKQVQEALDAIPIPAKEAKKKPEKKVIARNASKPLPDKEEPSNVVPYGQGAPVSAMYSFNAGGTQGGFNFSGGGGGDFGSRYGWYVDVVRRKVSENWLKYEIDPRIASAARCYVTFDITRSGQPANVRVEQSSGVPSLDISAVRALQRIDSFGPLPSDYSGSRVSVEFYFDYHR
jgi:periplasmic protein TonB